MMDRREFLFGRAGVFSEDEKGATAIEYGLIAGLMAVGLVGALTSTGKLTKRNLNCVKRAIKGKEANKFCSKRGA